MNPKSASHTWQPGSNAEKKVWISVTSPEKASTCIFCWLLYAKNQKVFSSAFSVQSELSKRLIWDSVGESQHSAVTCSSSPFPPPTQALLDATGEALIYMHHNIYILCQWRERVSEEMHLTDCRDAPQDYNTGQVPGLTGLHILKLSTASRYHLIAAAIKLAGPINCLVHIQYKELQNWRSRWFWSVFLYSEHPFEVFLLMTFSI